MIFLLAASLADSLLNFRGPLIAALQSRGLEVHVVAPNLPDGHPSRLALERLNIRVHTIAIERTGLNPFRDLSAFWNIFLLMRRLKPQFFLGYTVKPVIYGSIAAWLAHVPNRYALITGLGFAFQGQGQRKKVQAIVTYLYRIALSTVHTVFFQNGDDEALFRQIGILRKSSKSCIVNGSGVDIDKFVVAPFVPGPPQFLLVARLLGDKGIREYVLAAKNVRKQYPHIRFALVGWVDKNPNAISQLELDAWVSEGAIDYLGYLSDVRPAMAASSVYVLPSYREGTPRTVLEAMAVGRAIITTDAPGCRETVIHGENGFLIPVRSIFDLEQAVLQFIQNPNLILKMGARSRQIVEDKYDVRKVNAVMISAMGIE